MPTASLALSLACLVPLAWLVPNHYLPWLAAWQDGVAIGLLCAAALLCFRSTAFPRWWGAAIGVALVSVAAQWALGKILFSGDALMAAAYLIVLALAIALGVALTDASVPGRAEFPTMFAAALLAAAILSTAVAWVQWTGALSLGIYGAEMRPGGRPFANVAQPNHFCSIAFMGLCALAALREAKKVGRPTFALAAAFLLSGMVMSGSRTGWVQMAMMVVALAWFVRRTRLAVGPRAGLMIAAAFAAMTLVWPLLAAQTALELTRPTADQLQAGTRIAHWQALADAVGREPLWGYGWQQLTLAQQAVALEHAPVGEQIDHAHNLLLDLIVWAGLPVGVVIAGLIAVALWRELAAARDPRVVWLLVAVLGVLVHSMLEYPYGYAYFLIPVGLALGVAHSLARPQPGRYFPAAVLPVSGALLGALFAVVAVDYLAAEENYRVLRLESARIGVSRLETPAAQLRLLDHQQAFLEFARTEARPGMAADELEWMRRVSERFAHPPAMFRYALAAGLNGQPEAASRTLGRLCRIHARPRCDEGREAWAAAQTRYPELRAVDFPD